MNSLISVFRENNILESVIKDFVECVKDSNVNNVWYEDEEQTISEASRIVYYELNDLKEGFIFFIYSNKKYKQFITSNESDTFDSIKTCEIEDEIEYYCCDIHKYSEMIYCEYCERSINIDKESEYYMIVNECQVVCMDCISENASGVQEDILNDCINQTDKGIDLNLPFYVHDFLIEQGFIPLRYEYFVSGLHEGDDDTVCEVLQNFLNEYNLKESQIDYVFAYKSNMFTTEFMLYIKNLNK